jgi:riboflavin biosynthesis pyrimidine reductase
MLTLLRSLRARPVYLSEPASFLAALVIAEIFYKFHSFLLETGAFLLTWLVLAALVDAVVKWIGPKPSASQR